MQNEKQDISPLEIKINTLIAENFNNYMQLTIELEKIKKHENVFNKTLIDEVIESINKIIKR